MSSNGSQVPSSSNSSKNLERELGSDSSGGSTISGGNEEEYLRAIWTKLGVGDDGYLSVEDLNKVCHAIGMGTVASEVIEQLFSRLDVDGDGKISFDEFLHMFQSGGPESSPVNCDESMSRQDTSLVSSTSCIQSTPATTSGGILLNEFGMFSSLDPDGTGQVSVNRLVEVWFSLGVSDGTRVLRELGLPHRHGERVRLKDLSNAFEDEWRPQSDNPSSPRQAALLTLVYEVKGLRMSLEAARGERDKYKWDLNEANNRLVLLAQELDENNIDMEEKTQQQIQILEKQYRDHVRELQEALAKERDSGTEKALDESKEILNQNMQLQEEETKLQRRIIALERDVKRLEIENLDLCERLKEASHTLGTMEKQITQLNQLKSKVAEFESFSPREDEFRKMVHRVEELLSENQKLRDNNDELLSQMDSCRQPLKIDDQSLDGSCIGDYLDQSCDLMIHGGIKRRGFRGSGEDESSGPEEESPRGNKIRKRSSSTKGANVHYVDVTTYDVSNVDSSISSENNSKGSCVSMCVFNQPQYFTRDNLKSSPFTSTPQPSSLPLSLNQSASRADVDLRKRLDKQKKVETMSDLLELDHLSVEEDVLRIIGQELEKEVESLKQERDKLKEAIDGKLDKQEERKKNESTEELCLSSFSPRNVSSSTPVKPPRKCSLCKEIESRHTLTMEELRMALSRESQLQTESNEEREMAMKRQQALLSHCKELEEDLANIKYEAAKVMEQNELLVKNNEELRMQVHCKTNETVSDLIEHLCQELIDKIQRKRQAMVCSSGDTAESSLSRDAITTIIEEDEPDDEYDRMKRDQSPSFKLERIVEEMEVSRSKEEKIKDDLYQVEMQINLFEEDVTRDRDFLEKQRAIVQERCAKSENDLENLRCEFEKSEDYWNLKLQEEQDYYDEERKLYDEKFVSLESKIREYEDLLLNNPAAPTEISAPNANTSDDSDRLSTIDESVAWEKQINELDEELQSLRKKYQQLQEERETVELFWREKLSEEQRNSLIKISQLKNDLEHSNSKFNSLESQANATKEQLEYLQASFQQNESNQDYLQVELESDNLPKKLLTALPKEIVTIADVTKTEESLISNLRSQLSLATKRVKQLEHSLKVHQKNSSDVLNLTHERHQSEIQSLQAMIASTQQMFSANLAKYKDQLSKVTRSDMLVRELYLENSQLMMVLKVTEARQKVAEESVRKYQMATLTSQL